MRSEYWPDGQPAHSRFRVDDGSWATYWPGGQVCCLVQPAELLLLELSPPAQSLHSRFRVADGCWVTYLAAVQVM